MDKNALAIASALTLLVKQMPPDWQLRDHVEGLVADILRSLGTAERDKKLGAVQLIVELANQTAATHGMLPATLARLMALPDVSKLSMVTLEDRKESPPLVVRRLLVPGSIVFTKGMPVKIDGHSAITFKSAELNENTLPRFFVLAWTEVVALFGYDLCMVTFRKEKDSSFPQWERLALVDRNNMDVMTGRKCIINEKGVLEVADAARDDAMIFTTCRTFIVGQ